MSTWRGVARPADDQLLVSEIFGPTLQGEGPSAGRPATFVRLGGCNLSCRWCDTPYTWDAESFDLQAELSLWPIAKVVDDVLARGSELVVVTGGEPLLQGAQVSRLLQDLQQEGRRVEFETNGTRSPKLVTAADKLVVSPKLANSGLPAAARINWSVLEEFAGLGNSSFKFVVEAVDDLAEVEHIVGNIGAADSQIWIMPQAVDSAGLQEAMAHLAPAVAARGWALSSRLQVLLWRNERGH